MGIKIGLCHGSRHLCGKTWDGKYHSCTIQERLSWMMNKLAYWIVKEVFRNGHWHLRGEGDAEDAYNRLSYSWSDLGEYMFPIHSAYFLFHIFPSFFSAIHESLPPVDKVEISKSTDQKSDSSGTKIYEASESPKNKSIVGLTRFVTQQWYSCWICIVFSRLLLKCKHPAH